MGFKVLASIGIVLGLMLVASVALAAFPDQGVGRGNTTTWVMNVHHTLDANVVATYIDRSGYPSANVAKTISPQWNAKFAATDPGLDSGWLGSAFVDSLRPIVSAVEAHWEDVPRGDGQSAAGYIDVPQGSNELYFPGVSKSGYWRSRVSIQCVDTVDCDVSMTYRDREGNVVTGSPFLDTIEAGSQETYDLWDPSVNPNIPEQSAWPAKWFGNLQVTSTGEIAGVAVTHARKGHASAYNSCVPTGDTEIYFPALNRRNFGGDWLGQSDWSTISLQNTNAFTITAQLNFYHRDGTLELSFAEEIAPYASAAYNMKTDTRFEDLEHPFGGSAVVTSTHPIVGSCSGIRVPYDGLSAAYTGVPGGSSKLVFPVAYRVKAGTAWRKYSGVVVQNVDPANEITVYAHWFHANGDQHIQIISDIAANGSHGYNTRYGDHAGTLADLGNDWSGTVVVTTTSPLGIAVVAHSTIKYTEYAYLTNYNGLPVD